MLTSLRSTIIFIWWSIKVELSTDKRWEITSYKNKLDILEYYLTLKFLEGEFEDSSELDILEKTISELKHEHIKTLLGVEQIKGFDDFIWFYEKLCLEERMGKLSRNMNEEEV